MNIIKKFLNRLFIDGLTGMAHGLFATLIIGTIIDQIGDIIGGTVGAYLVQIGGVAMVATGMGIGTGVAAKLKASPLVTVSAAVAGMVGAFAGKGFDKIAVGVPGEPLGAFVAAYVAVEIGMLVSGKTKVDIIVTPLCAILPGAIVGIYLGTPVAKFMNTLGELVNVNVAEHPIMGGMLISVLMGMILTLPISSAAIGLSMGISGLAAGAATVGCCCNMVGFAVASYRENKVGGLISQGIGTSMLQVPNIVKKPIIWLPAILSSAILGPISSAVLGMVSNPTGSGMGSAGLVGQFSCYTSMVGAGFTPVVTLIEIAVMHFVLPAIFALAISEGMRALKLIKYGDMKLSA
ncbi:MAG: PTS sugar transporter subunit IIC [Clostridia bacterium]|nr:PTS sugar transporter subunit IIC [Clostridia bacterium]